MIRCPSRMLRGPREMRLFLLTNCHISLVSRIHCVMMLSCYMRLLSQQNGMVYFSDVFSNTTPCSIQSCSRRGALNSIFLKKQQSASADDIEPAEVARPCHSNWQRARVERDSQKQILIETSSMGKLCVKTSKGQKMFTTTLAVETS